MRQTSALKDKKVKHIYLLEASLEGPRAHELRHRRRGLELNIIPIKAKIFSAAAVLIWFAGAFGTAIHGRSLR